jgi:hypothetical protein
MNGVDDARKAVRERYKEGADLIDCRGRGPTERHCCDGQCLVRDCKEGVVHK